MGLESRQRRITCKEQKSLWSDQPKNVIPEENIWTMRFHQEVWIDKRFLKRKSRVIQMDIRQKSICMADPKARNNTCVIRLVREWLQNPEGLPYMGHNYVAVIVY